MKKCLAILLVVIVVVTGVPLVMAGPVMCDDCGPAAAGAVCLIGVLVLGAFVVTLLVSRLRRGAAVFHPLLLGVALERPPRLV